MDTMDLTEGPSDGATEERSYSVDDLSPGDMIHVHRESSVSEGGSWRLYDHYGIFLSHDCRDHGLAGGPAVVHYGTLRHGGHQRGVDGALPRTRQVPIRFPSSCSSGVWRWMHQPRAVAA